jgi:predicted phage-related endonuclease
MHKNTLPVNGEAIPDSGSVEPSSISKIRVSTARRTFIGGSDARTIMGDDEAALLRLWKEKRGEVEPEDLSGNLLVQLGTVTEHLNRHWYEKNTGRVVTEVQRQERLQCLGRICQPLPADPACRARP